MMMFPLAPAFGLLVTPGLTPAQAYMHFCTNDPIFVSQGYKLVIFVMITKVNQILSTKVFVRRTQELNSTFENCH